MSIIAAIKTYILTYTGLETGAPVWVNHLNENPINYAIIPLAGTRKVSQNIHGNSGEREYIFAFQSAQSTADELERLESSGFFEALADWMDTQSESDVLPVLPSGQEPYAIEVLGFAYLYEQGQSDTGIYQVQCRFQYYQEKP